MDHENLNAQIVALVDHLRTAREASVTLTEVASVTEVLVSIMERYFRTLDTSLYREFRTLASYIENAKVDIAKLRPKELKSERLPRAGKQLDAVVKATEEATQTIMDAAEEIMAADETDAETHAATVDDACMRIIEACAFQDITGQRITKVVETLTYIENRLAQIEKVWGAMVAGEREQDDEPMLDEEQALLTGPRLDGEGNDQSGVDALLDEDAAPAVAAQSRKASQAEIDALFD